MTEQWKYIPGFDGWYEVSNFGRIRSYYKKPSGHRNDVPKLLKLHTNPRGYAVAHLSLHKKRHKIFVHNCVMMAFHGYCPDGLITCHKDGNPLNNNLDNLRYDTPKSNAADRIIHGNNASGEKNGRARLTSGQVDYIRSNKGTKTARSLATELDVSMATVYDIWQNRRWKP